MSLPILTSADFVGVYLIPSNVFDAARINLYITEYEQKYLRFMLSDKAYIDIKDQETLNTKYSDLIDGGIEWTDDSDNINYLDGLKEILKGLIYYEIFADNWNVHQQGKNLPFGTNSESVSAEVNKQSAYTRYNKAMTAFNCDLVPYIEQFKTLETTVTDTVDEGANLYTLTVADTKYMQNGDTLTIGGSDYVISAIDLDADTFQITAASTGLDFDDDVVSFDAYKD